MMSKPKNQFWQLPGRSGLFVVIAVFIVLLLMSIPLEPGSMEIRRHHAGEILKREGGFCAETFYQNGGFASRKQYIGKENGDFIAHGKEIFWKEDGSKWIERNWREGLLDGPYLEWDKDGKLVLEGSCNAKPPGRDDTKRDRSNVDNSGKSD